MPDILELLHNAAKVNQYLAEIEQLRAACERMIIGGNHIAVYRTEQWPDYGTDHEIAQKRLGDGQEYDMWCCWNAIMCARKGLEDCGWRWPRYRITKL